MIKRVWPDIKWLFNYMMSILMYAVIVILVLIGVVLLTYFLDVTSRAKAPEWVPPLYGAYVIVSGSMDPTIKVNDAIIIKRTDSTNINVGDVVTYKSTDPSFYGIMITHRVIDIVSENGETKYVTKGDSNATRDRNPVSLNQIYGKVVMRIPKLGYLQYFLATAYGWILAVVLPCVGIIVYDIIKLVKTIKNNSRNQKRRNRVNGNEE